MEVGCLRHPGAPTTGSQLQDGDCNNGWQKPDNLTISLQVPEETSTCHTDKQWKEEGRGNRGETTKHLTQREESHTCPSKTKPLKTIGHCHS